MDLFGPMRGELGVMQFREFLENENLMSTDFLNSIGQKLAMKNYEFQNF